MNSAHHSYQLRSCTAMQSSATATASQSLQNDGWLESASTLSSSPAPAVNLSCYVEPSPRPISVPVVNSATPGVLTCQEEPVSVLSGNMTIS